MLYYFTAFFFVFLIGLRGNDDEYTSFFLLVPRLDSFFSNITVLMERGAVFAFIISALKTMGFNSQSLLLFFPFFSILIHAKYYCRFTKFYFLALLIYLSHEIIFHEWIQIRAGLASAMVLPMIYYLQLGKKKIFFILYIVSSLIHYISIISIILFWICRPIKTKWLFLGICMAFVIHFFGVMGVVITGLENTGLLPKIVTLYLNWESYSYKATLLHPKTFQQIITAFFVLYLLTTRNISRSKISNSIINVYILSVILQISLNDYAIFAFRAAGHFYVVEPILVTYIIMFFKEKKILLSLAVVLCIFLSYINYVHQERLEPYKILVQSN